MIFPEFDQTFALHAAKLLPWQVVTISRDGRILD